MDEPNHIIRRTPENDFSNQSLNENWAKNTIRDVLMAHTAEQRRSRIWRNIWRFILLACFGIAVWAGRDNQNSSKNHTHFALDAQSPHTAVIRLDGEISSENDPVQLLREGFKNAYDNSNVKAIIIRANSPGGSPVVSNIAFEEIRRLKSEHSDIPVYIVAQDMCASGCYYIAAAADKIYADPSSLIGSIGVIGSSFDATGLMEKLGVKRRIRIAGNNKGMGDPFSPETPEQTAIWQQMLNQIHQQFIQSVKTGRGDKLQEKAYLDLFSGRIFTGIEAKKAGLIDDFGNVYSVARDVVHAPNVVDYTPDDDDLRRIVNRYLGAKVEEKFNEISSKFW